MQQKCQNYFRPGHQNGFCFPEFGCLLQGPGCFLHEWEVEIINPGWQSFCPPWYMNFLQSECCATRRPDPGRTKWIRSTIESARCEKKQKRPCAVNVQELQQQKLQKLLDLRLRREIQQRLRAAKERYVVAFVGVCTGSSAKICNLCAR